MVDNFVTYESKRLINFLIDRLEWILLWLGFIALIVVISKEFLSINKSVFYGITWGFTFTMFSYMISTEYNNYKRNVHGK